MDTLPFDVAPIIARLAANVPALRLVAGAADYATVSKLADFAPPCAYVLLARERPEPSPAGNGQPGQQVVVAQRVPVTFGVVHAVRNFRQALGAQSAQSLRSIIGATRACLLGYTPEDAAAPCQLQRGDLIDYDKAVSVWTDVYTTQHFIGVNPS